MSGGRPVVLSDVNNRVHRIFLHRIFLRRAKISCFFLSWRISAVKNVQKEASLSCEKDGIVLLSKKEDSKK
jgi:hypothetical protein